MSRWFRFYADAMRNPKVLRLSDKDFRLWVRLLAVASESNGHIAPLDDLRRVLTMRLDYLKEGVKRLVEGGLIDMLDSGYEPHNWSKFQYKSDVSTSRVHKHREKRNVSETPPETETDTETEVAPKGACASGDALTPAEIVDGWNELAADCDLPTVRKLTTERKRKLAVRLREYPDLEDWQRAFRHIRESPFLRGENRTAWKADFDFLLQARSFTKLTEEAYGK